MTLKPEDRALIERTRPVPNYSDLKACAQMARFWSIEEGHLAAIIDAARSAGPVSSGEGEPVAWRMRFRSEWAVNGWSYVEGVPKPDMHAWDGVSGYEVEPLYAAPPPALPDEVVRLVKAATEIINACEEDCGVPDAGDEDDEAVGASSEREMALTFGIMRRVRAALAPFADRLPTEERAGDV